MVQEHIQKDDLTGGNSVNNNTMTLKKLEAEIKARQAI